MPTVGRTDIAANNQIKQNTGSNNQYAMLITMPETGLIKTLHVYVNGNGSSITGQLVLWNSAGNVVGQTGNITFSGGDNNLTVNHQAWQVADLLTPYLAAASEQLYIGFWRASASTANFSWLNSGSTIHPDPISGSISNVGSPGHLDGTTGRTGQLSAYADYVKGGLGYYTGSVFNKYALKRYNGSAFQRHPLNRWSGSTWEWFA